VVRRAQRHHRYSRAAVLCGSRCSRRKFAYIPPQPGWFVIACYLLALQRVNPFTLSCNQLTTRRLVEITILFTTIIIQFVCSTMRCLSFHGTILNISLRHTKNSQSRLVPPSDCEGCTGAATVAGRQCSTTEQARFALGQDGSHNHPTEKQCSWKSALRAPVVCLRKEHLHMSMRFHLNKILQTFIRCTEGRFCRRRKPCKDKDWIWILPVRTVGCTHRA
jgi:hypothetical protein